MSLVKNWGRVAVVVLAATGCGGFGPEYEAMTFTADGERMIARGVIDDTTLDAFETALDAQPDATTLVLQHVGGSVDDDANLVFSRAVHDAKLDTMVPADGMIASGGTDLFAAGAHRSIEAGACVGVHSWGGDDEGANLPDSDPRHEPYLRYFRSIGVDENFYWYTLDAAPANGMHWMSATEIDQYDLTTDPSPATTHGPDCDER